MLCPGTQVTPFLLESIRSKTGGKSLAANIQLVKNNAAVGSQIAAALSALG
jgi:pseudouridine-5'-phosphate glycosidase